MTARQKENRRRTLLRSAVQLFFFLLMPGAFTAGFACVKYIFTQVGSGSVIEMNGFLKVLLMLLLFTVFFGRFFCGYLCAFGSLGDALYALFGFIRKKLFKKKKPSAFPPKLMRILQKLKYVNLAVIALFCVLGLFGKLAGWSVWDVFSRLTALKGVDARYLPGAILLAVLVLCMMWQSRFFCQVLCPMGALFALLPVLPYGALKRDAAHCIPKCNACERQCPVSLKLSEDGRRNGECIGCEKCAGICPKQNISGMIPNPYLSVLIRSAVFFAAGCGLGLLR